MKERLMDYHNRDYTTSQYTYYYDEIDIVLQILTHY